MPYSHNTINRDRSALIHLPPEQIEAILSFLPPKSLGRFKSVSKGWHSLISSPNFIKNHIQKFNTNNPNSDPTHLILLPNVGDYSLYSLHINKLNIPTTPETVTAKRLNLKKPCFQILGSCNGLVLAKYRHPNLYLVNPTIEKTLKVLIGKGKDDRYGFGYDSSTDDYKIISISNEGDNINNPDTNSVRVYSLRNNSWRNFSNPPNQLHDCCRPCPGVLFNNNLHFIVGGKRLRIAIAAFSLADEEFHIIELPDFVNIVEMDLQLFALGEKLAAVICVQLHGRDDFVNELWVMDEYGVHKSWTKLCNIENAIDSDYEFYAKVGNRDILVGNSDADKICIYNMDDKRFTSVTVEGCREDFSVIGTYVESLESLQRFP